MAKLSVSEDASEVPCLPLLRWSGRLVSQASFTCLICTKLFTEPGASHCLLSSVPTRSHS